MTYGIRNVVGVVKKSSGLSSSKGILFDYSSWPSWAQYAYDLMIGCHVAHALDFLVALVCYLWIFPETFKEAHVFKFGWMVKIVMYNIACEILFYGFWHHLTYASRFSLGVHSSKYNKKNQYEPNGKQVGYIWSTSGQLQREVLLTTLGWLQSSAYQIIITHLWASGKIPFYLDFWKYPVYSIFHLLLVTYWREFHFYWVHRAIHPWWSIKFGLSDGDIGAFLYKKFHSLHHKSYNPGPWSGLAMHPVEHMLYYTCTLLCLFFPLHPLHFLYAKFHADIAPIGGHDGHGDPCGGADFHYLHHSKFECNYGVPLINFDKLFGTFVPFDQSNNKMSPSVQKSSTTTTK
eukprot:TRINITY_DN3087_c0_g1_i2.p1 TRINITY_DN3087_c0_g1~~TRINITY_DN3087_c0_g1_i2.p1  ORF type:complete len:346 (+),score=58.58 TRINITY_DN3087_c0_g1_i2:95-1132(+)